MPKIRHAANSSPIKAERTRGRKGKLCQTNYQPTGDPSGDKASGKLHDEVNALRWATNTKVAKRIGTTNDQPSVRGFAVSPKGCTSNISGPTILRYFRNLRGGMSRFWGALQTSRRRAAYARVGDFSLYMPITRSATQTRAKAR